MAASDEEKTGFHTEKGVYCFTHMPKELKNSTATLQIMMEKVLTDQSGRNVEVYLEEIVVKSKSEQDLVQDVEETLRKLKRVNIKIDPNTSSFGVEEGRFLGHMITKEGVRANPEKEAEGSVVKKFFGQGEQVQKTPDASERETSDLSKKLQAKSTATPRA
ncbi:reverse transcriptase domain-containing protein [Tanacetum coccineum]